MQDRPTAKELVDAVAAFVESEVTPTVADGRLRFRTLIAANVLNIVARELGSGPSTSIEEMRRLATFLDSTADGLPHSDAKIATRTDELNRAWCARIRAGEFDPPDRFAAALDLAEWAVVEKLRINNPRYLARLAGQ